MDCCVFLSRTGSLAISLSAVELELLSKLENLLPFSFCSSFVMKLYLLLIRKFRDVLIMVVIISFVRGQTVN